MALCEAKSTLGAVVKGALPLLQFSGLDSSGAEYTPLQAQCQYLVAIFFFNATECVFWPISSRNRGLFRPGTAGEEKLIVPDVAIMTIQCGKRIGGFFEHLLGHGD